MACDQPQIPTLALLGCCGSGDPISMDWVVRWDSTFPANFTTPLDLTKLANVLSACEADSWPTSFPGKVNGVEGAQVPQGICVASYAPALWPVVPELFNLLQHPQATHGYFGNQVRLNYFAVKVRWRLPSPRRWCVLSCSHIIAPVTACGTQDCDPSVGAGVQTLMPAGAMLEVLPDALSPIADRPFVPSNPVRHDFTWKIATFDGSPPASPFCGLP